MPRYNQPQEGADNWGIPLNENFADLAIDVEHRGPDADKSAVTPADGSKYLATDTAQVYLGDGSDWSRIGDLNAIGVTERQPSSLTVGSTQTAVLEIRRFEQFSTDSISIDDGGSIHIRRLRHMTPP